MGATQENKLQASGVVGPQPFLTEEVERGGEGRGGGGCAGFVPRGWG